MSRIVRALMALATMTALGVVTAAPARAEPSGDLAAAATCYGGFVRKSLPRGGTGFDAGPYTTSTRCVDINVRNASVYPFKVCVIFVSVGTCNYWTTVPTSGAWRVAATNVRDNTRFYVRVVLAEYKYEPLVIDTAY
ncbi:hypothetical protein Ais01nite_76920 [Asanoa ishikariensis]|uniref:Secreted protein n=1 Tax=Asanoa ishikariensis TaxID=137265 RepID=A0A1H3KXE2_9ACTN|nr:hypothetical protein [Asanoa ishikariensis]GIF69657.1 hypothetical protein Ais01nite_76920 [Asanoa ishikariensis]SDY56315.1 hypothetical protein SAMN05421684_0376 [Asanoa ishikariensis]